MNKDNTIEELWEELKTGDKDKDADLNIADMVSEIIFKIVKERNIKGLTQRDLAKLTGLKQPAIARLESLQTMPRIDTLAKIVYYLDLDFKVVDLYDNNYVNVRLDPIEYKDDTSYYESNSDLFNDTDFIQEKQLFKQCKESDNKCLM